MGLNFLDAHTHAQFAAYDADRKEVIERAFKGGVGIINVGTEESTSEDAVKSAYEFPGVWASVGLHPTHASGSSHHDKNELRSAKSKSGEIFDYDLYKKLAKDNKVVAIGECGLDYFRLEGDVELAKKKQKEAFLKQIELALEVKKPLMIHCRSAFEDLIEIFKANKNLLNNPPGVIHFFTGTEDDAKNLLDLGFYFTLGGVITFVRDYDEIIKSIPVNRILSETDAPYVTPVPHRGKRNEPVYVIEVVKRLAQIKDIAFEEMSREIMNNATVVFDID
ncbi:MAG: TatD family hydrolase [Patescibacteria group bacterium]